MQILQAELAGMGFKTVDSGERAQISAQLARFEIVTPATALYWDINGNIELLLEATGAPDKKHHARYAVQCTQRTYSWPGDEIIGAVLQSCLKDLGGKIRSDTELASFLEQG
jgi:uncharacterized lipoprotein YajG